MKNNKIYVLFGDIFEKRVNFYVPTIVKGTWTVQQKRVLSYQ